MIKAVEATNVKNKKYDERIKYLENRLKDVYISRYYTDSLMRINKKSKTFNMNQSLNKSFSYFENRDKKLDTSNKDKHVKRDK